MLIVPLDENLETVVYLFPNPRIIKSTQIDVSTKYSNNKSRPHQSENSRNSPPTGGKDISIRPEVDSAKQQRLDPTFPPIHPFPRSIQQSRSNADFAIRKPSKSPTREGNGKRASVGIIIRVNVTRSGYRIGRRPIGEGCRALSLSVSGPGHGGSRVRARTRPYSRLAAQRIPRIRLSTVTRTNTLARGIRGYSGMDLLPLSPSGPYWIFDGPAIQAPRIIVFFPLPFFASFLSFLLFVPIHFAIWSDYPMCVPRVGRIYIYIERERDEEPVLGYNTRTISAAALFLRQTFAREYPRNTRATKPTGVLQTRMEREREKEREKVGGGRIREAGLFITRPLLLLLLRLSRPRLASLPLMYPFEASFPSAVNQTTCARRGFRSSRWRYYYSIDFWGMGGG